MDNENNHYLQLFIGLLVYNCVSVVCFNFKASLRPLPPSSRD